MFHERSARSSNRYKVSGEVRQVLDRGGEIHFFKYDVGCPEAKVKDVRVTNVNEDGSRVTVIFICKSLDGKRRYTGTNVSTFSWREDPQHCIFT